MLKLLCILNYWFIFETSNNQKHNIMTAISKKVKEMYSISRKRKSIIISKPSFIIIDNAIIESNKTTHSIKNEKCVVTIWNDILHMHITIFK